MERELKNDIASAAVILEFLKNNAPPNFSSQVEPLLSLAEEIPCYSGNIIEMHCDREHWFDFSFRINPVYDKPLLPAHLLPGNISLQNRLAYQQLLHEEGFKFNIENIWFEYDAPFDTEPAFFFNLSDTDPGRREAQREIFRIFNYAWPGELDSLVNELDKMDLSVGYLGFMFSRAAGPVRITIKGIEPGRLFPTLQRLKWKGNYAVLKQLEEHYLSVGQSLVLAIDYDNGISNRLGIEVYEKDYSHFLHELLNGGLINDDHFDLIKNWPGEALLPPSDAADLTRIHNRPVKELFRRTNHMKFIIDEECVKAKAYLYYCF